jgi:hypothetical protein
MLRGEALFFLGSVLTLHVTHSTSCSRSIGNLARDACSSRVTWSLTIGKCGKRTPAVLTRDWLVGGSRQARTRGVTSLFVRVEGTKR